MRQITPAMRSLRLLLLSTVLLSAVAMAEVPRGGGVPAPSDDNSGLLKVGNGAAHPRPTQTPTELKVVSYNIRWRGGDDLRELIRLLREDAEIGGAAVIGLQEVDRDRKRTQNVNTARVMAESLGMNYAWAAPPNPRPKEGKKGAEERREEEETGVAILSPYPMSDVVRLVLPHEGPNRRRRAAVGATLRVGERDVRAYSVHAETRMPLAKKIEHWRAVLEDLERFPHVRHAVILGDFNTIKGKDIKAARRLFAGEGFSTPFHDDRKTFRFLFLKLKLDWVWLRGLTAEEHGIDTGIGLSDHWPLWVKIRLPEPDGPAVVTHAGTGSQTLQSPTPEGLNGGPQSAPRARQFDLAQL